MLPAMWGKRKETALNVRNWRNATSRMKHARLSWPSLTTRLGIQSGSFILKHKTLDKSCSYKTIIYKVSGSIKVNSFIYRSSSLCIYLSRDIDLSAKYPLSTIFKMPDLEHNSGFMTIIYRSLKLIEIIWWSEKRYAFILIACHLIYTWEDKDGELWQKDNKTSWPNCLYDFLFISSFGIFQFSESTCPQFLRFKLLGLLFIDFIPSRATLLNFLDFWFL